MALEAPLVAADLVHWLYTDALEHTDSQGLIAALARKLVDHGIAIDRATTAIRILHPLVRAEAAVWTSDGVDELRRYLVSDDIEEEYEKSPLKVVRDTKATLRCPIPAEPAEDEFGIVPDLRAEGYTDYVALPLHFSDGSIKAMTFATKAKGGFRTSDLHVFESILRPFAMICELKTLRRTAETLLDTYVGPRAGKRVLDGRIERGEGEWISAVVCFVDLRDFTPISNTLPPDKLIPFLNAYFGAVTRSVEAHGGEVLKFIGDEVLAIFPYETAESAKEAAVQALLAARDATAAIEAYNADNTCPETPTMKAGIALHAGDVFYGNVGGDSRLDFTVIGPVVNLASRIAELAKDLDARILVTDALADVMRCRSGHFGTYQVKGFADPVNVYSPELLPDGDIMFCPESAAVLARDVN